ncbi:hypothetical protein CF161_03261 [Pseudomonas sp. CF161]|nr:hypothetical protein CF161_03261 [Pseudomonas sp. CF161]
MPTLTIAAAQSISVAGDLPGNIARHLDFMAAAAAAEQGRLGASVSWASCALE